MELGAALTNVSNAKRIILVGIDRTDSVFYDARGVEYAADLSELYVMLGLESRPGPGHPATRGEGRCL